MIRPLPALRQPGKRGRIRGSVTGEKALPIWGRHSTQMRLRLLRWRWQAAAEELTAWILISTIILPPPTTGRGNRIRPLRPMTQSSGCALRRGTLIICGAQFLRSGAGWKRLLRILTRPSA